jgi:hypothetical protein
VAAPLGREPAGAATQGRPAWTGTLALTFTTGCPLRDHRYVRAPPTCCSSNRFVCSVPVDVLAQRGLDPAFVDTVMLPRFNGVGFEESRDVDAGVSELLILDGGEHPQGAGAAAVPGGDPWLDEHRSGCSDRQERYDVTKDPSWGAEQQRHADGAAGCDHQRPVPQPPSLSPWLRPGAQSGPPGQLATKATAWVTFAGSGAIPTASNAG